MTIKRCESCGKTFQSKGGLGSHRALVHQGKQGRRSIPPDVQLDRWAKDGTLKAWVDNTRQAGGVAIKPLDKLLVFRTEVDRQAHLASKKKLPAPLRVIDGRPKPARVSQSAPGLAVDGTPNVPYDELSEADKAKRTAWFEKGLKT